MEKGRGFNFKLLIPPRVNTGQVSISRPQEIVENCGDFGNTLQQGYSKGFEKEQSMPFPNRSIVAPAKSTRQDFPKMKVVPPMEKGQNNWSHGQLYSKLVDEVEKIKYWKVKVDSETMQKEARLQENKRTIETQRKAIQELQFGNESLSVKLEEQISENEELRSKNNATRNLCNVLKDTFERSAEKMHLFETEREETHHLLVENSGNIQKLIEAFESLRIQAEVDQQEMLKVKEALLQYDNLKETYHQEFNMKEKEVAELETKIKGKENELQKLLLDLHETQRHCKQLQEATDEQHELLKSSKTEQKSLLQKLQTAELHCTEMEKNREVVAARLEQSKEEYAEVIRSKDLILQELSRVKNQQAEKLEEIQITIQELQESLSLETQRAKGLEDKLIENNKDLEMRNTLLAESMEQSAKRDGQIKILEDELVKKSQTVESMKGKIDTTQVRLEELTAELSKKTEEAQKLKELSRVKNQQAEKLEEIQITIQELQESLSLETQRAKGLEDKLIENNKDLEMRNTLLAESMEQSAKRDGQIKILEDELVEKSQTVESMKGKIDTTQVRLEELTAELSKKTEEAQKLKMSKEKTVKLTREVQRLEEENQCLREEVNSTKAKSHGEYLKSETLQKKMEENMQKLRITAAEAVKNKEDTELKCQQKIADMVALMEKHKSQYDRMVEEKDAELDENKKKKMEAVSQRKLLELDLATLKVDNDQLKQQLKTEIAEREKVGRELTDVKKEMLSRKNTQLSEARNQKSPAPQYKLELCSETPKDSLSKRYMFDFSKVNKTPSYNKDGGNTAVKRKIENDTESTRKLCGTTLKTKKILNEDLKTPKSITNRISGTSTIKSYRIRTPPPAEKTAGWERSTIELDPRSDSSDQIDLLTFASKSAPSHSTPHSKLNNFKQSPIAHKSPGNSLKLAAMKRMRDAGWTAVTGSKKKKRTTNEKIFA